MQVKRGSIDDETSTLVPKSDAGIGLQFGGERLLSAF